MGIVSPPRVLGSVPDLTKPFDTKSGPSGKHPKSGRKVPDFADIKNMIE